LGFFLAGLLLEDKGGLFGLFLGGSTPG